MKKKKLTSKEFDDLFDGNGDVVDHLDLSTKKQVKPRLKRVNIDFPHWIVESLDREAARLGISRQSLVKIWIAEKFDKVIA